MTPDEFADNLVARWPYKTPAAIAEDCRAMLREYSGDVLARVSRRIVASWDKDRSPRISDILAVCRQEAPAVVAGINRKQQFDYVRERVPQILSAWKIRHHAFALMAARNGWGLTLKQDLWDAAHIHAQTEWLIDNGHLVVTLQPFDPAHVFRHCYYQPREPNGNSAEAEELQRIVERAGEPVVAATSQLHKV